MSESKELPIARCTGCGHHRVFLDPDKLGDCPECGGFHWMLRWPQTVQAGGESISAKDLYDFDDPDQISVERAELTEDGKIRLAIRIPKT